MSKTIRKFRHWKQRYDPNAVFICRRRIEWGGVVYETGDSIPDELAANKGKLRRFWEAGWIELAEFEAPNVVTGQPSDMATEKPSESETADIGAGSDNLAEGVKVEQRGSWYVVTLADGSVRRAQGAAARDELMEELREEIDD